MIDKRKQTTVHGDSICDILGGSLIKSGWINIKRGKWDCRQIQKDTHTNKKKIL